MKEMAIHTWFRNELKKKYGKRCIHIKPPSGIYSTRRGISDFILCIDGKYIAIEVKTLTGKVTLIQQNFLDEISEAGGLSLVLWGKDKNIFEKINDWVE